MYHHLLHRCLALLVLNLPALAFDFSFTAPTSCNDLTLTWKGGSGPFELLITPLFFVPINLSIPASSVDTTTGDGSFTVPLNLTAGQKFLLTMSDSTGFNAGGTSDVLQVGSVSNGASCNTTGPDPGFLFQLNSALQQCRTFTFSDYGNASQPVRILGLIPLGEAFELDPPAGRPSFDWTANVAAGTSVAFIMVDAKGGQGGSSDLKLVGQTDDDSCIDASSPHSTISASSTQPSSVQATQTVVVHGSGNKTGAIVGGVLGSLAFLALVLLAVLCCMRRHRKSKKVLHDEDDMAESHPNRPPAAFIGRSLDLLPASARHSHVVNDENLALRERGGGVLTPSSESGAYYMPSPYVLPGPSSVGAADGHSVHLPSGIYPYEPQSPIYTSSNSHSNSHSRSHSRSQSAETHGGFVVASPTSPVSVWSSRRRSRGHSRVPSQPLSISSNTNSPKSEEAGGAGSRQSQQRFILHRDADDVPSDAEEEVVELPPQYTDRREKEGGAEDDEGKDEEDKDESKDSPPSTTEEGSHAR